MSRGSFVHLHVHTHFSLLDGATRIGPLIQRARQYNMPAVAITDHGNLFGAIEFYTAAREADLQPIIGCEAYLSHGDRHRRHPQEDKDSFHLLLLAMNLEGYRNLMRLSTIGFTEGFYRRPRIDKDILRELSDGLLCTSTCIGGEIPQALLSKDRQAAEDLAKTYLGIFGPDRFFIELQDHGIPEQRVLNPELADMAKRLGVATIATNDVHYLDRDDVTAHDVLCCINTSKLLSDEDRFRFPSGEFYFKSPEEMATLFADYPESLSNTIRVARMCNVELDLSKRYAPVYKMPKELRDEHGRPYDDASYLRRLVYSGAEERYGDITPELRERIDYELEVVTSKGFASYFLIVWDCVRYAREHGIPAAARGSGCSSVLAYCLRISMPDPIRYGLFFERFMDPDRDEMPDIDLDICQDGRAQILEYVRDKYGHVAQIITFGTLKAKAVVKDVARVLGLGFDEANQLTKLIPGELNMTLDRALAQEPELKKRYEADVRIRKIIDIGRRLEGVARNASVHAAGVVVADQPLVSFLPLCRAAGQEAVVTQYDGPTVEKVGLLKMDFLGLRTLTTLEHARRLVEEGAGEFIDLEKIDLTDQRVYELFAKGDTRGIFQFESGGMREVVMRMKPNRIEDLIAANALFRPGPMEYISEYVGRKHGARWSTPHPIMTEVLKETYGIMVYQEQVSRIVNRLGGVELKAAFRLAKAISKKKTSMIESMREPFLEGCATNGVRRSVAEQVFADVLKFGGYAFNKAHSTGYALIAFQTAWMKTYYPLEFMVALMTLEMSSMEKVAEYQDECAAMGIALEPPDINRSKHDFAVEATRPENPVRCLNGRPAAGSLRFGLGAIKGVGPKAVAAIVTARAQGGEFSDLFDFCERVDLFAVNKGTLEALICAGAFDSTGSMRKALMEGLEAAMAVGQEHQRDRKMGQMALFGGEQPPPDPQKRKLTDAEWGEAEMLRREKAVLGFYITRHPLTKDAGLLEACASATIEDLVQLSDGQQAIVGGMVSAVRITTARSGPSTGKQFGIVTLEDLTGKIEAVLFAEQFATYRPLLVPDATLFFEGQVSRSREEPSLRVTQIVPVEKAMEVYGRALIVEVRRDTPLDELCRLFHQHAGECRVYLDVPTGSGLMAQIECHPSLRVSCTDALLAGLHELLPDAEPRILGPRRKPIPYSRRRRQVRHDSAAPLSAELVSA